MQTLTARRRSALTRRTRDVEQWSLRAKELSAKENRAPEENARLDSCVRKRALAQQDVRSLKIKLGLPPG